MLKWNGTEPNFTFCFTKADRNDCVTHREADEQSARAENDLEESRQVTPTFDATFLSAEDSSFETQPNHCDREHMNMF